MVVLVLGFNNSIFHDGTFIFIYLTVLLILNCDTDPHEKIVEAIENNEFFGT